MKIPMIVLACLALFSCHPTDRSSSVSVYKGKEAKEGDWLHAVSITSFNPQEAAFNHLCTGILVHPKLVLTAAHCLSQDAKPNDYRVYIGQGVEGGKFDGQFAVERFAFHPFYQSAENHRRDADIGYLLLADPVPASVATPVKILADYEDIYTHLVPGGATRIVGFGRREDNGIGRKFEVEVAINSRDKRTISTGSENGGQSGGDSGGPSYIMIKDEWYAFATTSSRMKVEGGRGTHMLIYPFACWIQKDSQIDLGIESLLCQPKHEPFHSTSFLSACSNPDGESHALTVKALKIANGTQSCEELETALKATTELKLSGYGIHNANILSFFSHFTKMDLSDNNISDIKIIHGRNPNLIELDITYNQIQDHGEWTDFIVPQPNTTDLEELMKYLSRAGYGLIGYNQQDHITP